MKWSVIQVLQRKVVSLVFIKSCCVVLLQVQHSVTSTGVDASEVRGVAVRCC